MGGEVHVPGRDRPSEWCAACRMTAPEPREDVAVAEVLREHFPLSTPWNREQAALALAPLIAEREAKAWDKGWAARADYSERRDVPIDWPEYNPYRADRRAER